MYITEVNEEWNLIDPRDLWVYNKLFLSRVLGYKCGPAGTTVPRPDFYIVRPSINFFGMGRYARIKRLRRALMSYIHQNFGVRSSKVNILVSIFTIKRQN